MTNLFEQAAEDWWHDRIHREAAEWLSQFNWQAFYDQLPESGRQFFDCTAVEMLGDLPDTLDIDLDDGPVTLDLNAHTLGCILYGLWLGGQLPALNRRLGDIPRRVFTVVHPPEDDPAST